MLQSIRIVNRLTELEYQRMFLPRPEVYVSKSSSLLSLQNYSSCLGLQLQLCRGYRYRWGPDWESSGELALPVFVFSLRHVSISLVWRALIS